MPEAAYSGDSVEDLLRKILVNQAGPHAWQSGDGERTMWRKILLNQVAGFPI